MAADVFDAFLSYHSGDADWVVRLQRALEARGVTVWLDRDQIRPGDRFVTVLEEALTRVRCVVVVLSPGSLRSNWVRDEYHRALALSNANPAALRLIAVLIGDVEPPGFLANRDWVDFRDPGRFAERLDELVFGITGRREGAAGGGAAADSYRSDPEPPAGDARVDEVVCLVRAIERTRGESQALRWYLRLAPLPGLGIAGIYVAMAPVSGPFTAGVLVAAPLVTGLVGWSATATGIARCRRKLEQYELLHDGLEACRARTIPGCSRLRENFWDMMQRQTRDAGGPGPA
ncbi:MAG: toll/interleukin-1 receptor domain-containing protein [Vicinamibacterales bacterium]